MVAGVMPLCDHLPLNVDRTVTCFQQSKGDEMLEKTVGPPLSLADLMKQEAMLGTHMTRN